MEVAERTKVSDLETDEIVRLYVQLRDLKATKKKAWEVEDSALSGKMDKLEALLLTRYQDQGIESARTKYGTAYKTKVGYASVADRDTFFRWVMENSAPEFLESRCSKTAVQQYIEEHKDLPPGINWREEIHIRVNRA